MEPYAAPNMGDARKFAQAYADRDGIAWIIYSCRPASLFRNNYKPYAIADKNYAVGSYLTKVETVQPKSTAPKVDPRGEPVYLTKAEKEIVAAVLHPDEPGRDYFPGTEEEKIGLRFKLLGLELTMKQKNKEITC